MAVQTEQLIKRGTAPTVAAASQPESLDALTGLRFIAAFAVLLFHYQALFLPPTALAWVINYGLAGVSLFFILSGFILTYTYYERFISYGHSYRSFIRARIARIYPTYVFALLIATPVTLVILNSGPHQSHASPQFLLSSWVSNLLAVQAWLPERYQTIWNSPSWSISDELFFYALFPIAAVTILSRFRSIRAAISLCLVAYTAEIVAFAIGYAAIWHFTSDSGSAQGQAEVILYRWPIVRLWEFLLGMALGRLYLLHRPNPRGPDRRFRKSMFASLAISAVIALIFILSAYTGENDVAFLIHSLKWYVLYTPLFCTLIYILARYRTPYSKILRARPMVILGEASYSLYLLHIIPFTILITTQNPSHPFGRRTVFLVILACVAASLLCYRFIETPARRWLRGGAPVHRDVVRKVPSTAHDDERHPVRRMASAVVPLGCIAGAAVLFAYCSAPFPGRTTLLAPTLGALDLPERPTLSWKEPYGAIAGRTIYRVVVSDGKTGTWVASGTTRALRFTPSKALLPGHQYFWGVVACGSTTCGAAGPVWSFWTASNVATPELLVPAEGQQGVSALASFRWRPIAADQPVTYTFSIVDGVSGQRVVERTTSESSYTPGVGIVLRPGRRYYWTVQACIAGTCSLPARAWGFDAGP